jgi:hypothetical protein
MPCSRKNYTRAAAAPETNKQVDVITIDFRHSDGLLFEEDTTPDAFLRGVVDKKKMGRFDFSYFGFAPSQTCWVGHHALSSSIDLTG